jgi:hypothetical protein
LAPRKPASPVVDQPETLDFPWKYAGSNWVLRFGYRASSRLKDHWNLKTDPEGVENRRTGDAKLAERINFIEIEDIPVMLWACMRSNHPDLTLEDVEEMVDRFGVNPIQEILAKVIAAALPPTDDGQKKTTSRPIR